MRKIGTVANRELADRFVDYLLTEGIDARIDADDDQWVIWAVEEDTLVVARESLENFIEHPNDARFQGHASRAKTVRKEKQSKIERARRNYREGRNIWRPGVSSTARRAPITVALIAVCVAVALWTSMGSDQQAADPLSFVTQRHIEADPEWDMTDPASALTDVRTGEVWRLVTPIFLHFGPLHLIFNMMWLHQLGGQIERRKGRTKYILIVLALAVFSNLAQALVARHPFFGGMSGVVYGLFGFIWMKVRFDPGDGFFITRNTVVLMMIWFVVCFLPGFGVANGGHAGGLLLGAAMGYISSTQR